MLALVLALSVGQIDQPLDQPPAPVEQPVDAALKPTAFKPPDVAQRSVLSGLAGIAGAGVALGLTLGFAAGNAQFDTKFSTAALGAILVTGGAFTVHQMLGGRGEITLALLGAIVGMGLGALVANLADQSVPLVPILTAVIGSVPAAALTVLSLEGTTPLPRQPVRISMLPSGILVTF
jgi:peptidoglycan/LPS O-acetylase OafA/YrhL